MVGSATIATSALSEARITVAEVFQDIGFDQALERAAEQKKVVLLDYYATWCVPCQQMDETTWVDPEVVAWLSEHAVAIRLDADVELARAVGHKVIGLPTTLLLRPDGSEIDRLTGYKSAEDLLDEIEEGLSGKDAVARARDRMIAEPGDLSARMRYGDALRDAGRGEEALAQYLDCWDAPLAEHPEFQGIRGSFLLSRLFELAEGYPPAREALEARRKMAEVAVLRGDAERGDEEVGTALIFGYQGLNERLDGDDQRSLELFDRVVGQGDRLATTRRIMLPELAQVLLLAQRYDTLLAARPPEETFAEEVRNMARHLEELDAGSIQGALRRHALESIRGFVVRRGLDSFEILLGAGQTERALTLAEQVVAFEDSPETWLELAVRARRVGDVATADDLASRAAPELGR